MVKLRKEDTDDLDVDELDAIEYSNEDFSRYDGEVPPKDIKLRGYVKKMWWTRTSTNNDPMIKVLWIADENNGGHEEYNGCPFWLNMALIGSVKFRWAPFLENYGITLKQLKNNTEIEDRDDQNGAPIIKVGSFRPGEGNDEAWCTIITDREPYNGEWKAAVRSWLPYDDTDNDEENELDPSDDNMDPEDEDEYDEDEYDEDEDEPEPEPAPAARGRRASARPAPAKAHAATPARGTRTARPAPAKAPAATPARGTRTARSAPAKAPAPAPAPARGRRSRGSSEDPPF